MLFFRDDYSDGVCPEILEAITQANSGRELGYGNDNYSQRAKEAIKAAMGPAADSAEVHLLVGGTQTNRIAMTAFLRPIEAVLSSDEGHIATHEAGAIEASGHKVIAIPAPNGKLTPELLAPVVEEHSNEHMVYPRLVYISNSTELGTIYTKQELVALRAFCDDNGLYLYLDGARLSAALCCPESGLKLSDIAELCDAFYIGGTKNGALMGEALVVQNPALKRSLRYYIKQNGALLAKGRFLGAQFEALMKDDLYLRLAQPANRAAQQMAKAATDCGYKLAYEQQTNAVFLLLNPKQHEEMSRICHYVTFGKRDGCIIGRFVSSYCTTQQDVEDFAKMLKKIADIK